MNETCDNKNARTLGEAVAGEIGKRGQLGMHFDFQGYKKLKSVDSAEEMQAFLDKNRFASVLAKDDPVWIVDGLEEAMENRSPPPVLGSLGVLSPLWCLVWWINSLRQKRRVYPSRRKRAQTRATT